MDHTQKQDTYSQAPPIQDATTQPQGYLHAFEHVVSQAPLSKYTTTQLPPLVPGRLIRAKQLAEYLGVAESTVWRNAKVNKNFPKPRRVSQGVTCWRSDDIIALMNGEYQPAATQPTEPATTPDPKTSSSQQCQGRHRRQHHQAQARPAHP